MEYYRKKLQMIGFNDCGKHFWNVLKNVSALGLLCLSPKLMNKEIDISVSQHLTVCILEPSTEENRISELDDAINAMPSWFDIGGSKDLASRQKKIDEAIKQIKVVSRFTNEEILASIQKWLDKTQQKTEYDFYDLSGTSKFVILNRLLFKAPYFATTEQEQSFALSTLVGSEARMEWPLVFHENIVTYSKELKPFTSAQVYRPVTEFSFFSSHYSRRKVETLTTKDEQ